MGNRIRQKGIRCTVEGCENDCRAKGLCINHSMALRRYGNVLGGKAGSRKGICTYCQAEMVIIKIGQKYHHECYKLTDKYKESRNNAMKIYRNGLRKKEREKGLFF